MSFRATLVSAWVTTADLKVKKHSVILQIFSARAAKLLISQVTAGRSKLKRFTQCTSTLQQSSNSQIQPPYADRQHFSTLKVSSKNESSRGWLISPVPHQKGWKWHFWWNTFFLLCQILQIFSLNHVWQLSSPWLSYSQHARTQPFTASSIQG